ncbi:hypothetical protein PTKIN_Ptkin02bG0223100 [Pterospermum kingtungense]
MLKMFWGKDGGIKIHSTGTNFQISSKEVRDWILEGGPWHIHNQLLIVKKWKPGIGYLASAIGMPLYMDKVTARWKRLAFARVCLEIKADQEIPNSIDLVLRNKLVHVQVSVPWLPLHCSKCKIFGHANQNCVKKPFPIGKVKSTRNSQSGGRVTADSRASSSLGITGSVNRFATLENEDLLRNFVKDSAKRLAITCKQDVKVRDEQSVAVLEHISAVNEATIDNVHQVEVAPKVSNNGEINNSEDVEVELPIDGLVDDRARKSRASALGFVNLMKSIAND